MKSIVTFCLLILPLALFSQTVLLEEDFETGSFGPNWRVDSTLADNWIVGTDSVLSGDFSAYVSSDDSAWVYNPDSGYERWLGAIIHIPENEPVLKIRLTWKGRGEPSWDDLNIQISDTNTTGDSEGGGGGEFLQSVMELNPELNINHKWISGSPDSRTWTFYANTGLSDTTVKLNFIWTSDGCCWFGEETEHPPQPVMIDEILVESFAAVPISEILTVSPNGEYRNLDEAWSALQAFGSIGDRRVFVEAGNYDDPIRLFGIVSNGEEGIANVSFEGSGDSYFSFSSVYLYEGDPGDYTAIVYLEGANKVRFEGLNFEYKGDAASAIQIVNSSFIEVTNCTFSGHEELYPTGVMRSAAIRIGDFVGFFDNFTSEEPEQPAMMAAGKIKSSRNRIGTENILAQTGSSNISLQGNMVEGGNFFVYCADESQVTDGIGIAQNVSMNFLCGIHAENYENLDIEGNLFLAIDFAGQGIFTGGISLGTLASPPVEALLKQPGNGRLKTSELHAALSRHSLKPDNLRRFLPDISRKPLRLNNSEPEMPTTIINNKILTFGGAATGFWPKATNQTAFYHNTLLSLSASAPIGTLTLSGENTDLILLNNIFYSEEGLVILSDSLIDSMDYNILYTSTESIGMINGTQLDSLKQLQDSTGTNLNSRFLLPDIAGDELFFYLNPVQAGNPDYFGTPTFVEIDFSEEIRSEIHPTIGADELIETVPVELSGLSVSAFGSGIKLSWSTQTELNNYGFEIERRSQESGVRSQKNSWEMIGFVAGKGTTSDPQSYFFVDEKVSGTVSYRLKQVDFDGAFEYSNEVEFVGTPGKFEVLGNYPNPFNPSTVIRYQLSEISDVNVSVYNILGQKVAELVNEKQLAGAQSVEFNAVGFASGLYIYKVKAGSNTVTRTMMLTK